MIAKTFCEVIEKFNPWHDRLGRFTSGSSGGMFSANPNTKTGLAAIRRAEKDNPLIGMQYGTIKSPGEIKAERMGKASRAAAKEVLKYMGMSESRESVKAITDLYAKIDRENTIRQTPEGIRCKKSAGDAAEQTARDILSKVQIKEDPTYYTEVRNYIRGTPVKISTSDKSDIADYGQYRKDNFGGVRISNKGISLDSFYQELSSKFPQHFDANKQTAVSDQLKHINDVLQDLKPKTTTLSKEEINYLASDMKMSLIRYYAARRN